MAHTALVLDVPATLQSLVREREDIFAVAGAFLPAYASVLPLEPIEVDLLGDLLAGRRSFPPRSISAAPSPWRARRTRIPATASSSSASTKRRI
jgi:Ser/Thr protein kinase RdoA (MazF antagonist)